MCQAKRIADAQNHKLEQLSVNEVNIAKLLANQGLLDNRSTNIHTMASHLASFSQ